MKVMLHKNRGTHMKNHKVEKGCILAALLFVLLWIGGSFPVNAKETGRGRVLFISSYSYAWETIPQQIDGIRKSLGDDVTIDYKFMDTKNVDTAENVHLFYKSLSYYLSQVPAYDVVIVEMMRRIILCLYIGKFLGIRRLFLKGSIMFQKRWRWITIPM